MAETFEDYLERTEKLLHRLEKNEEVDSYIKKINSFFKSTELIYPAELNQFLEKQKIKDALEKMSKVVNRATDKVKNFQIDYPNQKIMFENQQIEMVSSKKFVLDILKINEQSRGHYLVISLLSDQKVFELTQIYLFLKEYK